MYNINFEEIDMESLTQFKTFNQFFTRKLKQGIRPVKDEQDPKSMCSPCDGTVLTCGEINQDHKTIECVKGRDYPLYEFMFGLYNREEVYAQVDKLVESSVKKGKKMFYTVIYLAPSDYHRYHSPAIFEAYNRTHITGYLDPVKPKFVNKHKDVFKYNERVNVHGKWAQGFFGISFVGALNVGSIKLNFDETLKTNVSSPQSPYYLDVQYSENKENALPLDFHLKNLKDKGLNFKKADELGCFEMGSTIVLFFEADDDYDFCMSPGQKLNLGQEIFKKK